RAGRNQLGRPGRPDVGVLAWSVKAQQQSEPFLSASAGKSAIWRSTPVVKNRRVRFDALQRPIRKENRLAKAPAAGFVARRHLWRLNESDHVVHYSLIARVNLDSLYPPVLFEVCWQTEVDVLV